MKISELEALIANVRMFYGDINVEMWGSVEVDEDGNGADSSAPTLSVVTRNVGSLDETPTSVLMLE